VHRLKIESAGPHFSEGWRGIFPADQLQAAIRLKNIGLIDIPAQGIDEVVPQSAADRRKQQLRSRLAAIGDATGDRLQRFRCLAAGDKRQKAKKSEQIAG
jgi:cation diffusion facilitator CzcD-associated flavoprotein CzcO